MIVVVQGYEKLVGIAVVSQSEVFQKSYLIYVAVISSEQKGIPVFCSDRVRGACIYGKSGKTNAH